MALFVHLEIVEISSVGGLPLWHRYSPIAKNPLALALWFSLALLGPPHSCLLSFSARVRSNGSPS
jgi:hypothetical protein